MGPGQVRQRGLFVTNHCALKNPHALVKSFVFKLDGGFVVEDNEAIVALQKIIAIAQESKTKEHSLAVEALTEIERLATAIVVRFLSARIVG